MQNALSSQLLMMQKGHPMLLIEVIPCSFFSCVCSVYLIRLISFVGLSEIKILCKKLKTAREKILELEAKLKAASKKNEEQEIEQEKLHTEIKNAI